MFDDLVKSIAVYLEADWSEVVEWCQRVADGRATRRAGGSAWLEDQGQNLERSLRVHVHQTTVRTLRHMY